MSDLSQKLTELAAAHQQEAMSLLQRLVAMQGGSEDKAAVDRVGEAFVEAFAALGFSAERHPCETYGDHLVLRNHERSEGAVVLLGHMDTTYTDYSELPAFHVDGAKVVGPGTADMRGGLVVALYALRALEELGKLRDLPVTVVLNSDEERGSATSRELFYQVAPEARYALVFECGGKNNDVVVGRRGKLSARVEIEGRAGHAAEQGVKKASAIVEMAHQAIALEALNDVRHGTSVNVGLVSGGMASNTFPKHASIAFDVRFLKAEDRTWFEGELGRITGECKVEGATARWVPTSERPVWEESESADQARLVAAIQASAEALGQKVPTEIRWGTSDANFFAEKGVATVDGLGPVGFEDHTAREHFLLESFDERVALTALTLASLYS